MDGHLCLPSGASEAELHPTHDHRRDLRQTRLPGKYQKTDEYEPLRDGTATSRLPEQANREGPYTRMAGTRKRHGRRKRKPQYRR